MSIYTQTTTQLLKTTERPGMTEWRWRKLRRDLMQARGPGGWQWFVVVGCVRNSANGSIAMGMSYHLTYEDARRLVDAPGPLLRRYIERRAVACGQITQLLDAIVLGELVPALNSNDEEEARAQLVEDACAQWLAVDELRAEAEATVLYALVEPVSSMVAEHGLGWRNFRLVPPSSEAARACDAAVALGWLAPHGPRPRYGGKLLYSVTRQGLVWAQEQTGHQLNNTCLAATRRDEQDSE